MTAAPLTGVTGQAVAFDAAAEVVWKQLLAMHHRLRDHVEGDSGGEEFLTSVSQASLTFAEREYRGGLEVLCHLGYVLGLDVAVLSPHARHEVFSLKKAESALLDWAAQQNKTFPDNLRAPNFRN